MTPTPIMLSPHLTTPAGVPAPLAPPEPLTTTVLYLGRRWRLLLGCALAGLALGTILSLVTTPRYASFASFFAINKSPNAMAGLGALAGNLGLGNLQQDAEGPQFFADLVKTKELFVPVVKEPLPVGDAGTKGKSLADLYGKAGHSVALRQDEAITRLLEDGVSATVNTKTGVVRVVCTTKWPEVSYWLATRLLDRLNEFNLGRRRVQAGEERRFAESLLRAREDSLRIAENRLEQFVQSNREYRNSPSLNLTAERLQREVGYQVSVRSTVANMYQESRVREIRDTPAIVIIEPPRVPVKPESRGLVKFGLGGLILGLLLGIGVAVFWRAVEIQQMRGDPEALAFLAWIDRWRTRRRTA
jgi:hypothetical protein